MGINLESLLESQWRWWGLAGGKREQDLACKHREKEGEGEERFPFFWGI